jgi:hypothetical protein
MWRIMTTDTQSPISALTVEAGDLVIRTGRLAFASPQWTPQKKHRAPPPAPDTLAPGTRDLIAILDALHQAADAFTRMATADLLAISALQGAGRLYMPHAVLWGKQTRACGYTTAPDDRADVYRPYTRSSPPAGPQPRHSVPWQSRPAPPASIRRPRRPGTACLGNASATRVCILPPDDPRPRAAVTVSTQAAETVAPGLGPLPAVQPTFRQGNLPPRYPSRDEPFHYVRHRALPSDPATDLQRMILEPGG